MKPLHLGLWGLRPNDQAGSAVSAYALAQVVEKTWDWDAVVKGTHMANCWYNARCLINMYVKDGVVLREEQVGNYPPPNDPEAPDLNPRGCQKGVCYSSRMYDSGRLKFALKRAGPRGSGLWQRLSWDQALTEIADGILDVLATDGSESILSLRGTMGAGSDSLSAMALANALDLPFVAITPDDGDEHPGAALSWGKIQVSDSADNWFYSDMVLVWGGNPGYTHIANFHYIAEARYHGAKVVAITPDYNASSPYADLWVPIAIGSDAALALGMAQVIVSKGIYKADFVREQTDLPLLVRKDTRKLLTQKDMSRRVGSRENVFYMFDLASRRVVEAPWRSLALDRIVPALEGEYEVDTPEGRVTVCPVFELLKEHLQSYTPEKASRMTGVSPRLIQQLAEEFATARGVVNVSTANWGKHYHGDLIQRAQILLWALCGHFGRKGASYSAFPVLAADSSVGYLQRRGGDSFLAAQANDPRFARWREEGYTDAMILYEYMTESYAQGGVANLALLYHLHAGLLEIMQEDHGGDPYLKRPIGEYLAESLQKGWQRVVPRLGKEPKIILERSGQFLRRGRTSGHIIKNLLPKLKMLVVMDVRMSSTALYADYVLPAAAWYEKYSILGGQTYCPYLHLINKAVEPRPEAKTDWEIHCLLARRIEQRAAERGIRTFTDRSGQVRRLDNLYNQVTVQGLYSEDDEEAIARDFYTNSVNVQMMEWEEYKDKGRAAFTSVGRFVPDNACDVVPGEPIVPLTHHIELKESYPTLTRRMQFYIDHDWFLELGEAFPTHKDIPKMGGDHPLQLTGGHARWSIHSVWKDSPLLLRLQRGQPIMFMSVLDAGCRGVADGDTVEVFNNVASFEIQVAVSPTIRPGQVVIYHDWENFQFRDKRHFKSVMPSPLNPIELVGQYGHIRPRTIQYACCPGANDRGTRIDARKR